MSVATTGNPAARHSPIFVGDVATFDGTGRINAIAASAALSSSPRRAMFDRCDRVIRRIDAPVCELPFDRATVGLRDHQEVQPRDHISRDDEELGHLGVHVPATQLPDVDEDRSCIDAERPSHGGAGRSLAGEALDVGAARNHDHVIAIAGAEHQTSYAVGQHDDSGGSANRRALGALCDTERETSAAPPAEIDVFLRHQPADVEDQAMRRESGPRASPSRPGRDYAHGRRPACVAAPATRTQARRRPCRRSSRAATAACGSEARAIAPRGRATAA